MLELRDEVQQFAAKMERTLQKHDVERGNEWREMTIGDLFKRLKREMRELKWELRDFSLIKAQRETVDVANFAMFIWHRLEALRTGGEDD